MYIDDLLLCNLFFYPIARLCLVNIVLTLYFINVSTKFIYDIHLNTESYSIQSSKQRCRQLDMYIVININVLRWQSYFFVVVKFGRYSAITLQVYSK